MPELVSLSHATSRPASLTLQREPKLNAISLEMERALCAGARSARNCATPRA